MGKGTHLMSQNSKSGVNYLKNMYSMNTNSQIWILVSFRFDECFLCMEFEIFYIAWCDELGDPSDVFSSAIQFKD